MVAKQPSIPTKFSALQYRGVEFDTKPCSDGRATSLRRVVVTLMMMGLNGLNNQP
jgi:hypothetical protein